MRILFSIKYRPQIESGEYKVETGDKKRVRIICWDRKVNDFPVVALAYDAQKDSEIFINASVLGEPHTNIASDRLFIVTPEEELTEWQITNMPIADALKAEYEKGKAEALKDLPRWKKFAPNINDSFSEQRICKELENSVMRVDVGGYCWVINREELNKLPREDEK